MELTESPENKNTNATPPPAGEGSIEFNFRPLTSGLGFGEQAEEEKEFPKSRPLLKSKKQSGQSQLKIGPSEAGEIGRGELAPFYDRRTPPPPLRTADMMLEKPRPLKSAKAAHPHPMAPLARMPLRFFAYIIDLSILLFVLTATIASISFAANIDLKKVIAFNLWPMAQFYITFLFVIYYLFYFTFMDSSKAPSFGKALVNIKVQNYQGKRPNVGQAFLRSFFGLIDLAFLGIFCFFDIKEGLSETKVVKALYGQEEK